MQKDNFECNPSAYDEDTTLEAVCFLCDCCESTTFLPCKIFFWIYIGVLIILIACMVSYKYFKKLMI